MQKSDETITQAHFLADWTTDLVTATCRAATDVMYTDPRAFEFVKIDATGHLGTKSRVVDIKADSFARSWSVSHPIPGDPGNVVLLTEDVSLPWTEPGEGMSRCMVRLDPVDGTTLAAGTLASWATAGVSYRWSRSLARYTLVGAAIATSAGSVFSYRAKAAPRGIIPDRPYGQVSVSRFDNSGLTVPNPQGFIPRTEDRRVPEEHLDQGYADFIAISAAAGTERAKALMDNWPEIMERAKFRTVLAGNPSILSALAGRIGTIIDPKRATLHDSIYVLILAAAGWKVYHAETLQPVNVLATFAEGASPSDKETPMPPVIVTRSLPEWLEERLPSS